MIPAGAQRLVDRRVEEFLLKRESSAERQADGSWAVVVPGVPLSNAWSKPSCTIAFIVPAAFPVQRPDCFWADADLRLRNGAMPSNAGPGPVCVFSPMLWFSYHPQAWDIRDTVETYFHLVQSRLAQGR